MDRTALNGLFLVLGPPRAHWPAPLDSLLANHHIQIETTPAIHAIAAQIAGGNGAIRALLLDPAILTLQTLKSVQTIQRFIQIPIVLLPLTPAASPRAKEAPAFGILTWNEASAALGTLTAPAPLPPEITPIPLPPNPPAPAFSHPPMTDNEIVANTDLAHENSLTSHPANRYDELPSTPLVTPQELAALLGAFE
jgi:hypothetical protein